MGERPAGTVRIAGLDPRDQRVIGFVLRHAHYNPFAFRIAGDDQTPVDAAQADLVLANRHEPDGAALWASLDAGTHGPERIELVPPGASATTADAIALERLAVQLLPVLNRVFERCLSSAGEGDRAGEVVDGARGPEAAEEAGEEAGEATREAAREAAGDDAAYEAAEEVAEEDAEEGAEETAAELAEDMDAADGHGAEEQAVAAARVLVVDDSPTVRRQLGVALDRLGLRHEAVGSAARALERLAHEHYDLALVDVMMPDTDGYRLTREIRRDRRLRGLPVIILTSRSSPFDLARGALAGCDAYLTKPVPFRALEAAVRKQLRRAARAGGGISRPERAEGEAGGGFDNTASSRLSRLLGR